MKQRSSGPREAAKLSESIQRHLNIYAIGATAAGVGLLALSQPAEAKIVYTHANTWIANGTAIDLNHDHKSDFHFHTFAASRTSSGTFVLSVNAVGSKNRIWGRQSSYGSCKVGAASLLGQGVRIGPNQKKFHPGHDLMGKWKFFVTSEVSCGPWKKAAGGFLGLKFTIKGEVHYGWAAVIIQAPGKGEIRLVGYAYETVPNKPIITGKTNDDDDVEPATLWRLAQGRK